MFCSFYFVIPVNAFGVDFFCETVLVVIDYVAIKKSENSEMFFAINVQLQNLCEALEPLLLHLHIILCKKRRRVQRQREHSSFLLH